MNSSYKTTAKGHDDALTTAELVNLVQPHDLLRVTQQHSQPNCIVLWIEYASHSLFHRITMTVTIQRDLVSFADAYSIVTEIVFSSALVQFSLVKILILGAKITYTPEVPIGASSSSE